ncbi:TolC family protein [Hymenobacter psychrotolerans]|nr:TolC family protein [Hymenobacter psychrotolerans]
MLKKRIYQGLSATLLALSVAACKTPELATKAAGRPVPASYATTTTDSTNTARTQWRQFFTDPHLIGLIDTALQHNQELNISLQEIQIARNEVQIRKGEYLPFVGLGAKAEAERPSRNTLPGATEEAIRIQPEHRNPEPLQNYQIGTFASWEVDVWHKLRNARKSAALRYLATVEGRNFTVTNLIAEIATSYYELLALDNQLAIVRQNIELQTNALELVKLQKDAARTTELAVQRFEAQVHTTRSLQYTIQQRIIETENRLNFLVGRYPQPITRTAAAFNALPATTIQAGIPTQLLQNRPDIRQAEQTLAATKLDVQVARANFYPALRITGGAGFGAFKPGLLLSTPESMLYSLAGDLVAPLVNRNGIKAVYGSANAVQIQAAYQYERTILNAYVEVANQLASIRNLQQVYEEKAQAVQALNQSSAISSSLFRSARADYTEVLFTQRDALESRFELIETRLQQFNATVNVYRALGGGWK